MWHCTGFGKVFGSPPAEASQDLEIYMNLVHKISRDFRDQPLYPPVTGQFELACELFSELQIRPRSLCVDIAQLMWDQIDMNHHIILENMVKHRRSVLFTNSIKRSMSTKACSVVSSENGDHHSWFPLDDDSMEN